MHVTGLYSIDDMSARLPQLVFCGDFVIHGGWELGPRRNGDFEVVYFPAGSKTVYSARGCRFVLDEACFVFTVPGEEHRYYFDADKPIRHLFAHFALPGAGTGATAAATLPATSDGDRGGASAEAVPGGGEHSGASAAEAAAPASAATAGGPDEGPWSRPASAAGATLATEPSVRVSELDAVRPGAAQRPADPLFGIPPVVRADRLAHAPPLLKQIIALASFTPSRWRERASALIWTLLQELLSVGGVDEPRETVRVPAADPLPIAHALAYMEKHLYEPISIKALADAAGWTHEHFTRIFVQSKGMPPKQYVLHRRIERACEMLRFESLSIKEIAYRTGFHSEHYFSRVFTKIVGLSASKYREKHMDPRLQNLHLAPTSELSAPYPLNRYFVNDPLG